MGQIKNGISMYNVVLLILNFSSHLFGDEDAKVAEAQILGLKDLKRNYKYDEYCPVHGSKRKQWQKIVDMDNLVASFEKSKANDELSPILDR